MGSVNAADEGEWFPGELGPSAYAGGTSVLEVGDRDPIRGIPVDEFTLCNDKYAYLPACTTIKVDVCNGEMCFHLADDSTPYTSSAPRLAPASSSSAAAQPWP